MKWTTKFIVYKNGVFIAFFGGLALLIVGLVGEACWHIRIFFWLGMIGAALMGLSGPLSLPLQRMEEEYLMMKKNLSKSIQRK